MRFAVAPFCESLLGCGCVRNQWLTTQRFGSVCSESYQEHTDQIVELSTTGFSQNQHYPTEIYTLCYRIPHHAKFKIFDWVICIMCSQQRYVSFLLLMFILFICFCSLSTKEEELMRQLLEVKRRASKSDY